MQTPCCCAVLRSDPILRPTQVVDEQAADGLTLPYICVSHQRQGVWEAMQYG
jgi:hypothetical protein